MKLVYINPNPSGAYPGIQEGNFSSVPEGMAVWPDTLPTEPFYAYNGFVTLTVEPVKTVVGQQQVTIPAEEEGGEPTTEIRDVTVVIPMVTACTPNTEAWEEWKASLPATEEATLAQPTEAERLDALEAAMLAMMGGATTDG